MKRYIDFSIIFKSKVRDNSEIIFYANKCHLLFLSCTKVSLKKLKTTEHAQKRINVEEAKEARHVIS